MQPNDEVIYTITITEVKKQSNLADMVKALPSHIGNAKMQIAPVTKTAPGMIEIPRMFTRWRGDTSELVWQKTVTDIVGDNGKITISVQPWTYAPGYPQGETDL